ncbi:putative bifunctional diguanylate cyclase/phosphodiesterase [Alteromonas lipolytica]|uniref:Diguanylate cyclase n=1 Tax=Alteromonas lipolytica TaxID=1856405 RepID=A0A1E8FEX0_9ALTE|nr:bifunctional diguanylate cyclase/phosphodiesterase [Alteromonas lipolytica]OFI34033.1 hypothetical protein BFC17_21005 [Alteromonas lipolytica]GGF66045.1 hypothetical protein GCM10011338_17960 [Alteromonas lipolytica]
MALSQSRYLPSLRHEILALLQANAVGGLLITVFSFSAMTFGFNNHSNQTTKIVLWALMLIVCLLRAIDGIYWHKKLKYHEVYSQWPLLRFVLGSVVTALLWAAYCSLLYHHMDLIELATTMIIVAAMAGGAATVLSPHLPLVLIYTSLLLLPLSLQTVFDMEAQLHLLGSLGILFWLVMCGTAMKSNQFIHRAIQMKSENENLLALTTSERAKVERVNQELKAANVSLDNANASLENEVRKRTAELHQLSHTDPLTGLMNRMGFMQKLSVLISRARSDGNAIAVLFIDLDGFKQINDSLGHQAGDKVLSDIALKLADYSEADCIGRWGGDEFIIVLPHAEKNTAMAVALAIKSRLANLQPLEESTLTLGATIGIAMYPEHSEDGATLIQLADLTMYHQKHIASGQVGVYSQALYAKLHHEQTLLEGLRHAISQKELSVVYQPILDAQTEQLWAVEALLRWQFAGRSISPAEFIPLAEKNGSIYEIGNWVLHRACIDAAHWDNQALRLSVNVSLMQLLRDDFIASVDKALASSGLAPQRLHLEVTESIFSDDMDLLASKISALKARHIKVAIDDFGTGFSSLSMLQSLDFDVLKIDRSFVQQMTENNNAIVRATLLMANELGCKTVAEGIETNEQAKLLTTMGVDCLQGYLYARPMNNKRLSQWYTSWQQKHQTQ